ncbi:MAG: glycosyltransferase [Gammaproteobacteria bacterium]|nr:MAG: glycosyltransferase [Gammaproteobacteria bacterium]
MKGLRGLLLTADRFPPVRSDVLVLWAQEMVARGYQLDWIMQSREAGSVPPVQPFASGEVLLGAMDDGTSFWARLRKHCRAIANECRVFSRTKKHRYDFVLVRDKMVAALLARLAAWRSGTPCFFWLSFPFPENSLYRYRQGVARYPFFYWLRGNVQFFLLYRCILPRMDHVFVTSERMKQDLVGYGLPAGKITAYPMGIDISRMQAALQPPVVTHRHTVVYLGEMARARGLDFLLRAFQRVNIAQPAARLLMVGGSENPEDLQWLQSEAERLGIAHAVEFTGWLPQLEAWQRVREARVACSPFLPSPVLASASPTKLVEYLYLGVPAVVNEQPDQRQVISESQAGYVVAWDEGAFADAVLALLAQDDSEWRAMSVRGHEWVMQHRSYAMIADQLDARIKELLHGR